MLKREDIDHLATLARIQLSEEEKDQFPKQLEDILEYVSEVSKVATTEDITPQVGDLRNVLREDIAPNNGGEFTDVILENAPHKQDGYVKVQQIF